VHVNHRANMIDSLSAALRIAVAAQRAYARGGTADLPGTFSVFGKFANTTFERPGDRLAHELPPWLQMVGGLFEVNRMLRYWPCPSEKTARGGGLIVVRVFLSSPDLTTQSALGPVGVRGGRTGHGVLKDIAGNQIRPALSE